MPLLTLAPWERASCLKESTNNIEQAIHPVSWQGERIPFLFQTFKMCSQPYIFARPLESQDEGNWLVCEASGREWEIDEDENLPTNVQEYIEVVTHSLRSGDGRYCLARFCVVDGKRATPYAILFDDGEGVWLDKTLHGWASFGFSVDEETFRNEGRTVAELFEKWTHDPQTDVSFARRWITMDAKKRAKLLLGGDDNQRQIENVMGWTLLCEDSLWQYGEEWAWIFDHLSGSHVMKANEVKVGLYAFYIDGEFPFMSRIKHFLLQHHIPSLCSPIRKQHRCTSHFPNCRDFSNNYQDEYYAAVEVRGRPSAHERMEARLQLRAWLERNAYRDEIEAIGPF